MPDPPDVPGLTDLPDYEPDSELYALLDRAQGLPAGTSEALARRLHSWRPNKSQEEPSDPDNSRLPSTDDDNQAL